MPESSTLEPPIYALVQSTGDASEIVGVFNERGWHTTLSNSVEHTVTLLDSTQFNLLVLIDSSGAELELTKQCQKRGFLALCITTKDKGSADKKSNYGFVWSLQAARNNENLHYCERLVGLYAELARANSRSRLFIEAGHQLKSPVAVMKEFTHLLKAGLGGQLTEKQDQYLQVIDENIDRLLRLLRNVETLGSLDFSGWAVNMEHLDCREVIGKVAASWETVISSKGLALQVIPVAGQLSVMADRSAVEQILFNLIDNATKYCAAAGTIRIECKANNKQVHFTVANDGDAIPSALQESIFDPFQRLPDHSAEPGLGLGLTIARKLAASMQAELNIDASFTSGSRFLLSIPQN